MSSKKTKTSESEKKVKCSPSSNRKTPLSTKKTKSKSDKRPITPVMGLFGKSDIGNSSIPKNLHPSTPGEQSFQHLRIWRPNVVAESFSPALKVENDEISLLDKEDAAMKEYTPSSGGVLDQNSKKDASFTDWEDCDFDDVEPKKRNDSTSEIQAAMEDGAYSLGDQSTSNPFIDIRTTYISDISDDDLEEHHHSKIEFINPVPGICSIVSSQDIQCVPVQLVVNMLQQFKTCLEKDGYLIRVTHQKRAVGFELDYESSKQNQKPDSAPKSDDLANTNSTQPSTSQSKSHGAIPKISTMNTTAKPQIDKHSINKTISARHESSQQQPMAKDTTTNKAAKTKETNSSLILEHYIELLREGVELESQIAPPIILKSSAKWLSEEKIRVAFETKDVPREFCNFIKVLSKSVKKLSLYLATHEFPDIYNYISK